MEAKRRLILEEPEGDSPAPAPAPLPGTAAAEPTEGERRAALAAAINSEISAAYADMDALRSVASMAAGLPESDGIAAILESVLDDRAIHVGMLQRAADMANGGGELIDAGSERAEDVASSAEGE